MKVVRSRADFQAARSLLDAPTGLVLTMGALHAGHAALLRTARTESSSVVATVFVNPLQFGPAEDLARYPRSLEADTALCGQEGVDLLWIPDVGDVYPQGVPSVTLAPGPLGDDLEGAIRPGHFSGMLTVVAKFLNLVVPDRAYFGEKDYQQLTLIRRMAADLDLGAQIIGVPTVREADGLALSSRNAYLSDSDHAAALVLSRALAAGSAAAPGGAGAVLAAAADLLAQSSQVELDYLELRGPDLGPPPPRGEARLLVAGRVGQTRLIDNTAVRL